MSLPRLSSCAPPWHPPFQSVSFRRLVPKYRNVTVLPCLPTLTRFPCYCLRVRIVSRKKRTLAPVPTRPGTLGTGEQRACLMVSLASPTCASKKKPPPWPPRSTASQWTKRPPKTRLSTKHGTLPAEKRPLWFARTALGCYEPRCLDGSCAGMTSWGIREEATGGLFRANRP